MTRGRKNPYDALTVFLLLLLVLTVVLHIFIPDNGTEKFFANVTVTIEKLKRTDTLPDTVLADGRFSFKVISLAEDTLYLSCGCIMHPAGIMAEGGKLLSRNQPIALKADGFYLEGRIKDVKATELPQKNVKFSSIPSKIKLFCKNFFEKRVDF